MSIQTTYGFTSSINFNLSNTEIVANKLQLGKIPNPGQIFQQDFSSSVGFTFDASKVQFTGTSVEQKPQSAVPTLVNVLGAAVVADTITKNIAGDAWSTSGANSSEIITGDGYIQWVAPDVTKASVVGLTTNPNIAGDYSLVNFGIQVFLGVADVYELGVLKTTVAAANGDQFTVAIEFGSVVYKKNGVIFYTSLIAPSYPLYAGIALFTSTVFVQSLLMRTTATEYLGSKVDLPAFSYTGIGTIISIQSSTITEFGAPRYIVGGFYWNGSSWIASDGSYAQANDSATVIANLTSLNVTGALSVVVSIVFTDSVIQSSVDLISVTLTGQKYSLLGYAEPIQPIQVQDLLSYSEVDTIPANTRIGIILKVNGSLTWYNGTSWVSSDGSELQSNIPSDLTPSVLNSLVLSTNSSIHIRWLLTTTAQNTTPDLTSATIVFDFGGIVVAPNTCLVYGYVRDISGAPILGAQITFKIVRSQSSEYEEASQNIVIQPQVTVTSDVNGYFETNLIWSSDYEGTPMTYRVTMQIGDVVIKKIGTSFIDFLVPNAAQQDITGLITAL